MSIDTILAYLSRLFKTDMRYVVSGGFFLSLIQVSGAIASLILTIAFANLVTPETYGTYRYLLAVYGILVLFALPGLDTALIRAISNGKDGSFSEGLRTKFRWGILGSFAAFAVALYEFQTGNIGLSVALIVAGVALPFMESLALYSGYLNGKKRFKTWTLFEIISQIASVSSLIAAMLLSGDIVVIAIAYFTPYILIRAVAVFYLKKTSSGKIDQDLRSYARSVTAFQVFSHIGSSIDQIVLYHILGPVQVAIFALATAIPNRMQAVYKAAGILSFPKFAERKPAETIRTLPLKMLWLLVGVVVLAISYIVVAPILFTYLFPDYLSSLPYSQIIVLFTLSAITYPLSSYLFAHKKMLENYLVTISSLVAKVLALIIFVPLYGIWGAVIGVLVSSFVVICVSLYVLHSEYRKNAATFLQ